MQMPSEKESPNPGGLKFPFFDLPEHEPSDVSRSHIGERRTSATSGIFTPPPARRNLGYSETSPIINSEWDSEISPIAKSRDSDGVDINDSSNDLRTPEKRNDGNDIDTMLSELKDIINQSQKKRKDRYRPSSMGTTSPSQCDNDFLVDRLTDKGQGGESPSSPSPELKTSSPISASDNTDTETQTHASVPCNDLSDVRKQVDESSNNFTERIRDAAHQRKMTFTRSRDDLKAKEREQLQANAAAAEKMISEKNANLQHTFTSDTSTSRHSETTSSHKQFKARPLPETTGIKGIGGLNGVSKVAKKPSTTPFSPLLGARRPQKMPTSVNKKTSKKKKLGKSSEKALPQPASFPVFKARPVPSFVGREGQGGLTGVPKVRKRSATVPKSPMFGLRKNTEDRKENMKEIPCKSSMQSPMYGQTLALRGLELLEATPDHTSRVPKENDENQIPHNDQSMAYEPYSTIRAKKRADYDTRRDDTMKRKLDSDSKNRQTEIRRMQRELQILRKSL